MIIDEIDYLSHYGILRRSGRYPWGSGGDQMTRNQSFLDYVSGLKEEGLSEAEIAKGIDISVSDLRAVKSIARNEVRQANIAMAQRLANKGTSNVEIGRRMGIPESTVRSLLAPGAADAQNVLSSTANVLRMAVDANGYIDVGAGVEAHSRCV
jgi:DNA-binding CsgD family transcriptional regulator